MSLTLQAAPSSAYDQRVRTVDLPLYEFHAIDFNRKGVIRCVDVVQILTSLVGEEEEANSDLHVRVEALLGELGASYDTAITLPECMDIVALLMEPDEPSETKPHRGPDNGHKG
ncbi:hypothetical protein DYB26_001795 [Aphanomyces astaci]|uniref:Uncharacterized protein n=1 Tax=Aphanomyces astaci TaxID=112090 RepID=A0A418DW13_APHAT|nr:hypothetical protein DYB26_001795 [Aphanomyces astaci]